MSRDPARAPPRRAQVISNDVKYVESTLSGGVGGQTTSIAATASNLVGMAASALVRLTEGLSPATPVGYAAGMATIRTRRLLLRPAAAADLEPMHAILSDPDAMAYWSTPPHATREQTREWLRTMIDTAPDAGEDFIVERDGRVIGKAGLWRFPEVGYILRRDAWGRGFASEALRAVLGRAFDAHGLEAVEADVDPRNERSLRLLGRLGFHETARKARTQLVGDRWCDSVYLRLDRGNWLPASDDRQIG